MKCRILPYAVSKTFLTITPILMRLKSIYKVAAVLILFVGLQARKNGPGAVQDLRVTGAPGDGTCANIGCHTDGTFSPAVSITLMEGTENVNQYQPGKTYTLKVTNTPGNGTPARFGFQAVALNSANQQAGDWGDPGVGKHVVTLDSRKYVEHSLPAVSGVFEVPWIAPAAGTGAVTFYSASNAVNNNDSPSGDGMAKNTLAVQESQVSSTSSRVEEYASLQVLPNPVHEILNLKILSRIKGDYKLRFINMAGVQVKNEPLDLNTGINEKTFSVGDLAPGLYVLQLCGHGHLGATQMLKN